MVPWSPYVVPSSRARHPKTFTIADIVARWAIHSGRGSVPINLGYSRVFSIGKQPISFQLGGRYYAETPENGPDWGIRSTITFVFPTR
jgi:hypothetical protein